MMTTSRYVEATIEADEVLPLIRVTRDFAATPAQLMAATQIPSSSLAGWARTAWTQRSSPGMRATAASGVTSPVGRERSTASAKLDVLLGEL